MMDYKIVCPICGKIFITHRKTNLYCSTACKDDARRKRDREHKRAKRSGMTAERLRMQEQQERERKTAHAEKSIKARKQFEARCAAGDKSALLIRAKANGGNVTRQYWEQFAANEIDAAEKAGTISRTVVNGVLVYDDEFAEKVLESIRENGHVITELVRSK